MAAFNGHDSTAAELVRLRANVNESCTVRAFVWRRVCSYEMQSGSTALFRAVSNRCTSMAAELVRLGADVNIKNQVITIERFTC
jgi:hypothetical protein